MTTTTTVVPVVPQQQQPSSGLILDDRLPPRKTNLQRSKVVQSLSISGETPAADGQPKRIVALRALQQRLKSTLSTPVLDDTGVVVVHDLFNGRPNGKLSSRRRLSGDDDDQTDGSVMSSYQPLEVDLDDDAIMV